MIGPGPRQYETGSEREWVCPECGHREARHHVTEERPFCDHCDWQHGVLLQMKPEKNGEKVEL